MNGNVITSARAPSVRIALPESVQYVGADRWILYGVADCELHAWVEADSQKNVRRLYWIQFEGYVPSRPDLTYRYDSPRRAQLGGLEFYVDTSLYESAATIRAGSDEEHILTLIRARGYKMPAGMMTARLEHLLDERRRQELMIIYGEDVTPTGLTAAQLKEGGSARDQWPMLEKGLVEHAVSSMKLEPLAR